MEKVKEKLKKTWKIIVVGIVCFLLGCGAIGYAAYNYYATDISYTRNGAEMSVKDALDAIYTAFSSKNVKYTKGTDEISVSDALDELYASSYNPNYKVKLLTPPEDAGGDTGNEDNTGNDNTGTVTPGGDNNNSGGSSTGNGSSGTNQNKTNINANGQEFKMLLGVGLVIGLFAGLYAVANSFTPKKTRRARR